MFKLAKSLALLGPMPLRMDLEVLEFLGGDAVLVVVVALIHDELRTELVTHFFLELLQNIGGNGSGVAIPVHILFTLQLVEHQGELMEESGIADDVDVRMVGHKFTQAFHGELAGLYTNTGF